MAIFCHKLRQCFRGISVEPVAILFFGAYVIVHVAGISSMYYKICNSDYRPSTPGLDCKNLKEFRAVQNEVQGKAAMWNLYITLAYTLCAIPACLLMSAWGDLEGRKINMLVSFAGLSLLVFVYVIEICLVTSPLWVLVLVSAIVGCTGLVSLMGSSVFQYVSDIVEDKENLVVRMTICVCAIGFGSIIGGGLGGSLMDALGYAWTFITGEALLLFGMLYTLYFIEMKPSRAVQRMNQSQSKPESLKIIPYIRKLLNDVHVCYSRSREGRYKAYIFVMVFAMFLYLSVETGLTNIATLYAFNPPLHFEPSQVAYLTATTTAFGFLASMVAVCLTKVLQWADTSVILLSFASNLFRCILLGLSQNNWIYVAASFVGCLQQIGFAAVQAFVAKLVEPHETGKIIAGMAIASNVAGVVASLVYNGIYSATYKNFAGTVFFVASVVVLVAMALVLWVHVDYKLYQRRQSSASNEQEQNSESQGYGSTNDAFEMNNG